MGAQEQGGRLPIVVVTLGPGQPTGEQASRDQSAPLPFAVQTALEGMVPHGIRTGMVPALSAGEARGLQVLPPRHPACLVPGDGPCAVVFDNGDGGGRGKPGRNQRAPVRWQIARGGSPGERERGQGTALLGRPLESQEHPEPGSPIHDCVLREIAEFHGREISLSWC